MPSALSPVEKGSTAKYIAALFVYTIYVAQIATRFKCFLQQEVTWLNCQTTEAMKDTKTGYDKRDQQNQTCDKTSWCVRVLRSHTPKPATNTRIDLPAERTNPIHYVRLPHTRLNRKQNPVIISL